jgi:3',5'-cyclic AMP phosphodiesterase CpdA
MKIYIFTDTHLIDSETAYDANLLRVFASIDSTKFDLALHLGDIVSDGATHPQQLRYAAEQHKALKTPVRYVPGNHDIGDNLRPDAEPGEPVIDVERIAEFRQLFGDDYWSVNAPSWQLIGLNALLFNSGTQAETDQFEWLAETLSNNTCALGVVLHKPLLPHEDATAPAVRYVPEPSRSRLFELFAPRDLKFVASGHVHQRRSFLADGVHHLWVPSTAFCMPEAMQAGVGDKVVGAATLELLEDGTFVFEQISVEGLVRHNVLDHPEIYPSLAAVRARLGEAASALPA